MASKIADLFVNIGAKIDDFIKGTKQVQQETSQLNQAFNKVGGAIVAAFAADKIISFAKEASQLAQVAEGVEIAFKRIGGDQVMGELQKATKGTVSDLELMKAAVQAQNFGIPLKNLGSLLEFAHQRAKDTGQSVDYLVQSIVLGIGRKSPLILDNLGISAVQLKEKLGAAGAEAASVGDIAEAVGKIASEAMKQAGDSVDTTKEKTAQAKAEWENLKVEVGKFANELVTRLAPAFTWVIKTLIDGFKDLQDWIREAFAEVNKGAVSNGLQQVDDIAESLRKKGVSEADAAKRAFMLYKSEIEATIQTYEEIKKNGVYNERKNAAYQIGVLKMELEGVTQVLKQREKITKQGKIDLDQTKEKVDKLAWLTEAGKKDYGPEMTRDTDLDWTGKNKLDKLTTIGGLGLTGDTKSGVQQLNEYAEAYRGTANAISEATLEMSSAMSQFAEEFATGIGDLMAGASSFSDFGNVIIKAVASFMRSLGSQLIALGMAGIAAKMLAKNPYAALAAGIALVALSSAATAAMSGNPMSGGGGGYSVSSGSYSGMQSNRDMKIEIVGMVEGSTIYWSQKNYEKKLNNTTVRSKRK